MARLAYFERLLGTNRVTGPLGGPQADWDEAPREHISLVTALELNLVHEHWQTEFGLVCQMQDEWGRHDLELLRREVYVLEQLEYFKQFVAHSDDTEDEGTPDVEALGDIVF